MAGGGGEFQKPLPWGWTEGTMGPGSPEPVHCLGSADGSSGQSERQERRSGAPGKPLRAGGEAREEKRTPYTHTRPLCPWVSSTILPPPVSPATPGKSTSPVTEGRLFVSPSWQPGPESPVCPASPLPW